MVFHKDRVAPDFLWLIWNISQGSQKSGKTSPVKAILQEHHFWSMKKICRNIVIFQNTMKLAQFGAEKTGAAAPSVPDIRTLLSF